MRSAVGLCVLSLLSLYSSAFGLEVAEVPPGVLIFCDDPTVEKAVHRAVTTFNKNMNTGYKVALFQILTASKSEDGADSVYSLQFTSRRSDCPAGSNKSWTDCDYLPVKRKPFSCNATVHMTETEADTRQVACVLDDVIVPERAPCLGCPEDIDQYSDELRGPVSASISKFNSVSDSTHLFALNTVGHATRQVVAGFRFKLRFDMKKTICAKAEHNDLNELCAPDDTNEEFAHCNSTVDVAPWRLEPPQAHVECDQGPLRMKTTRRRPPGWTPLRNLFYDVPVNSTAATPQQQASATQAAPKEESSEEDTTAPKLSSSAEPSTDAVIDSPFHCPTKPWKAFNPVIVDETPSPTEEPATEGGVLLDTDLL